MRVIKSFPYRNVRNDIVKSINLKETTPRQLFELVLTHVNSQGAFRPYRNVKYDALKIYTHAHESKTMDLVINMDHDEDWMLDIDAENEKSLYDYGIRNETELSIFKMEDYLSYKKNPEEKWI